jgi:hypothetical protein
MAAREAIGATRHPLKSLIEPMGIRLLMALWSLFGSALERARQHYVALIASIRITLWIVLPILAWAVFIGIAILVVAWISRLYA